jgi:hypothetical protein
MQTNEHILEWTVSTGQVVTVQAQGYGRYHVTVAGAEYGVGPLNTSPKAIPAAAYQAGVRGLLMVAPRVVAVSAEHVTTLQAMDQAVTAMHENANAPRVELLTLESRLVAAREALTRSGYGATGERGRAVAEAEAALAAWQQAHPDVWAAVAAERQAKAEARREARRESVERAVRGED